MLQLRHMARVPFESLTLHYSKHHRLSLDLEDLFEKIVGKGRGGYCMEVNAFFGAVLRSLGYTLINVGGRVKAGDGEYKGWYVLFQLCYLWYTSFTSQSVARVLTLTKGTTWSTS